MATWANTLEGGTPGGNVTTGNSGGASGNAFTEINTSALGTASLVYSATGAHQGALGVRGRTDGNFCYLGTGSLGGSYQRLRFYFKMTSLPNTTVQFVQVNSTSGGIPGYVYLQDDGRLALVDTNEHVIGTMTNGLPLNTWVRIETIWDPSPSGGTVKLAYAIGDGAAVQTITKTGQSLGDDSTVSRFFVGMVGNGPPAIYWMDWYMDDLAADNTTTASFIGPASLNRLKVGSSSVALRLGTTTPGAVYAGTSQLFP